VLILDVARFKYPPHWVPLPVLFKAMKPADPATSKSRGFVSLAARPPFAVSAEQGGTCHGCLVSLAPPRDGWAVAKAAQELTDDVATKVGRALLLLRRLQEENAAETQKGQGVADSQRCAVEEPAEVEGIRSQLVAALLAAAERHPILLASFVPSKYASAVSQGGVDRNMSSLGEEVKSTESVKHAQLTNELAGLEREKHALAAIALNLAFSERSGARHETAWEDEEQEMVPPKSSYVSASSRLSSSSVPFRPGHHLRCALSLLVYAAPPVEAATIDALRHAGGPNRQFVLALRRLFLLSVPGETAEASIGKEIVGDGGSLRSGGDASSDETHEGAPSSTDEKVGGPGRSCCTEYRGLEGAAEAAVSVLRLQRDEIARFSASCGATSSFCCSTTGSLSGKTKEAPQEKDLGSGESVEGSPPFSQPTVLVSADVQASAQTPNASCCKKPGLCN